MAYALAVGDEAGNRLGAAVFGTASYLFPNRVMLPVDEQVAWCGACGRFVAAEELMTVDRTERRIEELFWQRYPDERTQFLRDALRCRQKEEVARRRQWFDYLASHRVSPPRCLECGSTDIAALGPRSGWAEWVPHPLKPGRVRVVCTSRFSGVYPGNLYTPEGCRIR